MTSQKGETGIEFSSIKITIEKSHVKLFTKPYNRVNIYNPTGL